MKKFWTLLNAVLFTVCVLGFALAGIAGASVQVLLTIGIPLLVWSLMIIAVRMRRPQQVYYIPREEEKLMPLNDNL